MKLKQLGFPGKIESFEKAVLDFSDKVGMMSSYKVETLDYKLNVFLEKIKQEELKRAARN